MAWDPILWIVFSIMNLTLLGLNFYQFLGFSDLEADYLNPYELSSRVNSVIVPEYLLQGAFCILFLVTGHWFMFLLSLPPAYYNLTRYLSQQHRIDVTEVFRVLNAEKKTRIIKLGVYIVFFALVITRTIGAGTFSSMLSILFPNNEELDFCLLYLLYMLYLAMTMMLCTGPVSVELQSSAVIFTQFPYSSCTSLDEGLNQPTVTRLPT